MKKSAAKKAVTQDSYPVLLTGIGAIVEQSRRAVVRAANCFMTATYWEVGRRIVEFEQGGKKRAEYGEELLKRLAEDLSARHGRGFGVVNLSHMKRFYHCWPSSQIFQTLSEKSQSEEIHSTATHKSAAPPISATLSRKFSETDWIEFLQALSQRFPLPWSHYVKLLTVKDESARRFYEDEALRGGWSVRQLDRQIGSLFYQRTLLSKDKAAMLRKGAQPQPDDALTVDEAMRDPCANFAKSVADCEHGQCHSILWKAFGFLRDTKLNSAIWEPNVSVHLMDTSDGLSIFQTAGDAFMMKCLTAAEKDAKPIFGDDPPLDNLVL